MASTSSTTEQADLSTAANNNTTSMTPPEEAQPVAAPAAAAAATASGSDDPLDQLFFAEDDDGDDNNNEATASNQQQPQTLRQGTTASARFNMWSTMVGGGCLSLPLAFQKTGNALGGPLLLLLTAGLTEFCFYCLVDSARTLHPPGRSPHVVGRDSYEGLATAALGPRLRSACTALVTLMCFFGIVGYAVLLRDMLEPLTDFVFSNASERGSRGPSWRDNLTMLAVVVAVTPLCTLQTLTALQNFGAASMSAIVLLGVCVTYRSLQCTLGFTKHQDHPNHHNTTTSDDDTDTDDDPNQQHHYSILDGFRLFPDNWKDVLDVIPLFISCYVCHYNIPVVHNELREPTPERVKWWLQSTVWGSTAFYLVLGVAGSAYGACTAEDTVQGNILLDFDEEDPLLLLGRMCLAVTITLAFPMLTIPARDILIRLYRNHSYKNNHHRVEPAQQRQQPRGNETLTAALLEPLLEQPSGEEEEENVGGDVESAPAPAPGSNGNGDDEQPEVVQATASQEEEGEEQAEQAHTDTAAVETAAAATTETTADEEEEEDAAAARLAAPASLGLRLSASVAVFWTGAAVASCVSSIDIVWDLLGSSLSIMLSFLIPCATYWVIARQKTLPSDDSRTRMLHRLSLGFAGLLLAVFVPLMFVSTGNAVYNTFFR